MMEPGTLADLAATIASVIFIWGTIKQNCPDCLTEKIEVWQHRLKKFFNPSMSITFNEFSTGLDKYNHAYTAIESYLSSKSVAKVTRLKAESFRKKEPLVFTSADYEDIEDEFEGVKIMWYRGKHEVQKKMIFTHTAPEKSYFTLSFDPKYREIVTEKYLKYVMQEGKAIKKRRKHPRIYMNNPDDGGFWESTWLEHPSSFDSFAMDADKKQEIINDLIAFSQGKEYYAKIGKAWKRGYLLYGPPGTGKSTMIVAMANLLGYNIYDLELTTVKDNAQLKSLLISTSRKGIIVVEDIDCSLDLTGKRKNKDDHEDKKTDPSDSDEEQNCSSNKSKITLSGFLNFVDGIWSACGGERIIVFTTNHVEKLDPALIRKGRMDMHIELSYCSFGGFKVLAKNYLDLDSHPLFQKIEALLGEVNMTPADVSEHLIHSRVGGDPMASLESLVQALETLKKEEEEENEEAKRKEEKRKRKYFPFSGRWNKKSNH